MSAGILVMFASEPELRRALDLLRTAGVAQLRTYTPEPLEGEPEDSPLPLIVFMAGVIGASAGFAMQVYANTVSYPLDIGGRPQYSWPAFIPITFEIGVLFAVLAGVCGYFAINRMPRLYDRIDELDSMREASRDGWLVAIRTDDAQLLNRARALVQGLHPAQIEELYA